MLKISPLLSYTLVAHVLYSVATVDDLLTVSLSRREKRPFSVALVGGDSLVSRAAQALVKTSCSPDTLNFALIPTGELR